MAQLTSQLPPQLWEIFEECTSLFDARQEYAYNQASAVMGQINGAISEVVNAASSIAAITAEVVPFDETDNPGLNLDLPTAPEDAPDISINLPSALPAEPGDVNVSISDIDTPSFDAALPSVSITPGEGTYSSTLLDTIRDRIISDLVTGLTGLDADVEDDIWNRNLQRDLQELSDAKARIAADLAKRGWPLPDGVLVNALNDIEIKHSDKRYEASKDIAIKQAEMTYQGVKDRLAIGVELEKGLMGIFSDIQRRLLEASRAQVEGSINIFKAQVDQARAVTDMYQAIVGARIEEAKAIVSLYASKVEAYSAGVKAETARIEGIVKAYVGQCEAYKAQVEAGVSANEVQIKLFECNIRASVARAEVAIKNAQIAVENQRFKESLEVQVCEVLLGALTQLEAGIMSSISLSAHISASNGANYNYKAPATIDEVYDNVSNLA